MLNVVVGLGPWILFWILNSNNTFEEAAVAGLVASIAVLGWSLAEGQSAKILELGSMAWFAVLTIPGLSAWTKNSSETGPMFCRTGRWPPSS